MRVFLSGNEDVARWHLPVAQSKVAAFADECGKRGLKQNRFTFLFEETGVVVEAQYAFGQVAMQIHAPFIPMEEESEQVEEEPQPTPKVFWTRTTQGYFWVEVRYVDGLSKVILTKFIATTVAEDGVSEEFVYPGMALTAPGMLSNTLEQTKISRYVVSQNGGVMVNDQEGTPGFIASIPVCDVRSRITISAIPHEYFLLYSQYGQEMTLRRLQVGADFGITRSYADISMAFEGGVNNYLNTLNPIPTWLHRKCSGSYFSPNKTIGYHVDTGLDDAYLGNVEIAVQDMLDNSGGARESLFNHSRDLYRLIGMFSFPIEVSGDTVKVLMVSPTMGFMDDKSPGMSKKTWGGYGVHQDRAGCADYSPDFDYWVISPCPVFVEVNFTTNEKEISGLSTDGNFSDQYKIKSWDGAFDCTVKLETEYSSDNIFFENLLGSEAPVCSWPSECTGMSCYGQGSPKSNGICPSELRVYHHWSLYFRENLINKKKFSICFGDSYFDKNDPDKDGPFYLMFDGLWHLDVGVLWSSNATAGNSCGMCTDPIWSQVPGGLVYFGIFGTSASHEWLLNHGHAYVKNLDMVQQLGYIPWQGGTALGFIARVPEAFEAPHPPEVLIGGVSFKSPITENATVNCESALMSAPCTCEDNDMAWSVYSGIALGGMGLMDFSGGCPPFMWYGSGVKFFTTAGTVPTREEMYATRSLLVLADDCSASVGVVDACGSNIEDSADASVVEGTISGPTLLGTGGRGSYSHDLGPDAVYTGNMEVIEMRATSAELYGPENAGVYTVSWTGKCGKFASKLVYGCRFDPRYMNPPDITTRPQVGQYIPMLDCWGLVVDMHITNLTVGDAMLAYHTGGAGVAGYVPLDCDQGGQMPKYGKSVLSVASAGNDSRGNPVWNIAIEFYEVRTVFYFPCWEELEP